MSYVDTHCGSCLFLNRKSGRWSNEDAPVRGPLHGRWCYQSLGNLQPQVNAPPDRRVMGNPDLFNARSDASVA